MRALWDLGHMTTAARTGPGPHAHPWCLGVESSQWGQSVGGRRPGEALGLRPEPGAWVLGGWNNILANHEAALWRIRGRVRLV